MAEAKLAPNLPDWMVEHANRYLASGGAEGHMYKRDVPGRGEITAPALDVRVDFWIERTRPLPQQWSGPNHPSNLRRRSSKNG
jgi:hypothetical protein